MSLIKSLEGKVFILEKFSIFIKYPKGRELKGGENMKNKKGLSTIVTTLIIILLVLVAIGIIWSVVKGLLDDSKDDISNSQKCLDIEFEISRLEVSNITENHFITIRRSPTGMEDNVGVKVLVYSESDNSELMIFGGEDNPEYFGLGAVKTYSMDLSELDGTRIIRVDMIPYFIDEAGSEVVCQTTTSKNY
jgi:hypothetical protein